jgi:hypothetical protein
MTSSDVSDVDRIVFLKLQEILEKFEFFPIKCRIQRAQEIFKMNMAGNATSRSKNAKEMKMKV